MKIRQEVLLLSVILAATSLAGCNGAEQITATTKDVPVYNDESKEITGTEKSVSRPEKEIAPDMSEYIKKEDVEALYVRKDEVQAMIDEAVEKATGDMANTQQTAQKGPKGDPGRGIAAVSINGDGDLCIAYTDGTLQDLGRVKGEKGDKGDRGDQGEKGDRGDDGIDGSDTGSESIPKNDYEMIGYVVPVSAQLPVMWRDGNDDEDSPTITITAVSFKLIDYNPAYANKYKYEYSYSYTSYMDGTIAKDKTLQIYPKISYTNKDLNTTKGVKLRVSTAVGTRTETYTFSDWFENPIKEITNVDTHLNAWTTDYDPI